MVVIGGRDGMPDGAPGEIERRLGIARAQLDADEFQRLLLLPDQTRAAALVRLEHVAAWLASPRGRGGDLPRYAEGTGVGPDRFYTIARDFARTRSVASLGVAAPGAAHGEFVGRRTSRIEGERVRVEAAMAKVLAKRPDASSEDLIAAARRVRLDRPPSLSALYKWAARLRAASASKLFGSPLATVVAIEEHLDDAIQHEVALVMDRGTGIVLGFALATGRGSLEAYRAAMIDGADRIGTMRLPVASVSGGIGLDAAAIPDPEVSAVEVLRLVAEHRPYWRPVDPDEALVTVRERVGAKLGTIGIESRLLPWRSELGGARTLRPSREDADSRAGTGDEVPAAEACEPVGMRDMEIRLASAVDQHNRMTIAELGGGREPARTRDARARMSRILASMRGEDG